jgi:8-oxo-dGTP pyrophosphatase MutT (NUDIX family)
MNIFIDDRPVRLTDTISKAAITEQADYDTVIDARLDVIRRPHFQGHLLVLNTSSVTLDRVFALLHGNYLPDLLSVTLVVANLQTAEDRVRSYYKLVKAAGGVVTKADQVLLMYRLGRWDLPKGKLDDGERSKQAAVREVEEETGVLVERGERICTTWHTYTHNENRILKRTKWYAMICLDDSDMQPQIEENIDEIKWMSRREAQNALKHSYSSIRYVFDEFLRKVLVEK